ncbi:MAG: hypothetical protein AAYR33_01870 [Acetobacteraceae bacterium]
MTVGTDQMRRAECRDRHLHIAPRDDDICRGRHGAGHPVNVPDP